MNRLVCAFVVRNIPKTSFLALKPTFKTIDRYSKTIDIYMYTILLWPNIDSLQYMYFTDQIILLLTLLLSTKTENFDPMNFLK